jgi:hypothetical protein
VRRILAAGSLALVALSSPLAAQTPPLVMSKAASGPISADSLSMSLAANVPCDETGTLIPDGSRLESDFFTFTVDAKGRGTFRGSAAVVTADGRPILHVILHGIVGLPGGAPATADCVAPGHLEGSLEPVFTILASGAPPLFREETSILEARFVADADQISASPLPLYRGRIDGFVSPGPGTPPPSDVSIAPDRRSYGVGDPITALVVNGSSAAIVGYDGESYCTIVRLERRSGDGWTAVAGCPLARMPLPTKIAPGETLAVKLPPDDTTPARWEPGTYRLAFAYLKADAAPTATAGTGRTTVVSPPFEVVGPPATPGVAIVTTQEGYRANEAIVAAISNGTDQSWVLSDHRSFCTLLTLERQGADGSWSEVSPCLLASPTRLVTLDPHQRIVVVLPPEPAIPRNEPGVYRLSTDISPPNAAGAPLPAPIRIESARFVVFGVRSDGPDVR